MASDRQHFVVNNLDAEVHRRSTRAGLAIRHLDGEREAYCLHHQLHGGLTRLRVCRRCLSWRPAKRWPAASVMRAKETSLLPLLWELWRQSIPETSFTEMFCPDWEGNQIFLSHMGEMNISSAASTPTLVEMPFPFTDVGNPAVAVGSFSRRGSRVGKLSPRP